MNIGEFVDEAKAEQLRHGIRNVRLIGNDGAHFGLLVPWPPKTDKSSDNYHESHDICETVND